MTVAELIEILKTHNPAGEVCMPRNGTDDQCWLPVAAVYYGGNGMACISLWHGQADSFYLSAQPVFYPSTQPIDGD